MAPWLVFGLGIGHSLAVLLPGRLDGCGNVDRQQSGTYPVREHLPDRSQRAVAAPSQAAPTATPTARRRLTSAHAPRAA
jgi:hypothetical protein